MRLTQDCCKNEPLRNISLNDSKSAIGLAFLSKPNVSIQKRDTVLGGGKPAFLSEPIGLTGCFPFLDINIPYILVKVNSYWREKTTIFVLIF